MSDEILMPTDDARWVPEFPFQQLIDSEARVDRLIALSENLAATCRNLTDGQKAPELAAPEVDVQLTGGTPSEILHAILEALKFHGIEKREGRGWQVNVGLQPPRTLKLLRDAIGHRIELAALVDAAATVTTGAADLAPLARLGQWTLEKIRGHDAGDVDAWAIQDAAKTFGVIAPVPAPKPCGPCCVCEEMDADTCYRDTEETKRARRALTTESVAGGDHVADASKMVADKQQCESGCGPATTADSEGVPLCDKCAWDLDREVLGEIATLVGFDRDKHDDLVTAVRERLEVTREMAVRAQEVIGDRARIAVDLPTVTDALTAALAAERGREG